MREDLPKLADRNALRHRQFVILAAVQPIPIGIKPAHKILGGIAVEEATTEQYP